MTLFGAIEAGGTKFVCGIGDARGGSIETAVVSTRDPDSTFAEVAEFFAQATRQGPIGGIGIASFGPVELNPAAPRFGQILATPKAHWQGADMLARTRAILDVPMVIETDVNAAALAEAAAAGPGVKQLAYVTVGTGIGVGLMSEGHPVHGLGHPEAGHILPRRHPLHDGFAGICPFHGDCLEGLASGPAIAAAWGSAAQDLPDDHPFRAVEADYLSQLCMTLFLMMAPERIVLGGGVMKQDKLFPMIHACTAELLGGYFGGATTAEDMAARIVPPACTEPSGLIGAYLLAEKAARDAA
ncbi:fructokinase [Sphingomonas zeicaulis]|uniref:ROK family protein n=1 Tax=Sphingomonas zeicaulis TaxID=1632740 RepID=UPI003D207DC5